MEDVAKGSRTFDSMSELERFAKETHGHFLLVTLDVENIRSTASDTCVARRTGDWSDEQFERSKNTREK